jgi:hypothetical protein
VNVRDDILCSNSDEPKYSVEVGLYQACNIRLRFGQPTSLTHVNIPLTLLALKGFLYCFVHIKADS